MPAPVFHLHTLANGLTVAMARDTHAPTVSTMLWYLVGSRHEQLGHTGVSHFLEHMLFKGSRRFAKGEIDRLTLGCGGSNNAFTWLDATAYDFDLPAAHWELALAIEADRMQGALLEDAEIAAEKSVILEEWQSSQDDPDESLWDQLNALALQHHPYRQPILGWEQDLRKLSREQIVAHYRQYYHPNQAILVLVGDLPENALERVEHYLGPLVAGPSLPPLTAYVENPAPGERRLWCERADIALPRLVVTWPAPALLHADYLPMLLLQYVLAEGWSSELHQRLVEEKQWATEVGAVLFATRDPYLFWLQLELKTSVKPERVERELFEHLTHLAHEGISAALFARARQQALSDYYLGQERNADRANFAGEVLSAGNPELLAHYPERLSAVTAFDLQRVLKAYFRPEQRCVAWLWPNKTPDSQDETSSSRRSVALRRERLALDENTADLSVLQQPSAIQISIPALSFERYVLDNGMLVLAHAQARTPLVSMALQIPAGSIYEASGLGGVASLTLATLLKGTHTQSAREFAERLEQHGASLSLSLGAFDVTLQLEMLASEFWPVMRVLHDGVVQAGYQTTEIRKERALLLAGLESDEESPGYRAHSAFVANVYAGSPLARPLDGTQEELRRLRPRQIHRFYQSFYQPNGSILALSGDLDLGSVAQSLPALWEDWQPRHQTFQPQFDLRPQQQRYIRHLDMPEREQCTLLWGHLGVSRLHPDFMALLVLDVILGNGPGFASRIPKRLRDEQGLCYQVSLSCTLGAQAFPGVVQAQVECLPEKADACLQGILSEIQRIQNDTVSLTELQAAQAYLNGQFAFLFETNAQRCHYLLQHENYAWPQNYLKAWSENLMNIEIQDIQRVAQQHLNTQNWTLITAGARPNWKETNT